MNQPLKVSIVVPMFNEKENVDALHAEIDAVSALLMGLYASVKKKLD